MKIKNKFKQRVPAFVSGVTPFEFEFDTLDELLNHPKIAKNKEFELFDKFCRSGNILLFINQSGDYYIAIGYVDDLQVLDKLPTLKELKE